ncbi:MAG TPA: hydrogenase nickel incorporation protein HypB [Byssovorax sp.]
MTSIAECRLEARRKAETIPRGPEEEPSVDERARRDDAVHEPPARRVSETRPSISARRADSGVHAFEIERALIAKNDKIARRIRNWLARRDIAALNFVSAPGAGKTTLLERSIELLAGRVAVSVIEGDQETERDAERIRGTGASVVQVNTGTGGHLDASMVERALSSLTPAPGSLLLVENVGSLVAPALYDLGENGKVLVASVTDGEDKPLKYPHMFRAARVLVINKIDLAPYVSFDVDRFIANVARVSRGIDDVFVVSAMRGDGMDAWCAWLDGCALRRRSGEPL